jgi:hypothetical protein
MGYDSKSSESAGDASSCWRDTLEDDEVLSLLREYNTTSKVLHRPQ